MSVFRQIVHLDLDTFFVSVERLENSSLNGRPVLIGGMSDRAVVASCSYEARTFGIHAGMSMVMAKKNCPSAIVIKGDHEKYSKYSKVVTEIIATNVPAYEKASVDEHYIDMTGMETFFGTQKFSHELRTKIIKETGLPISFGLSVNKCVSKIATGEAKPNGELEVLRPQVQPFLNPLAVRKIPGVGQKTFHTLSSMGISTIGTLSQVPKEMVLHVLGENGKVIWERANGIDDTPITPYSERKSISTETTFDKDTIDVKFLKAQLTKMVMELTYQLRVEQKLSSCIAVKIKYSNHDTEEKQRKIPYTSLDHVLIQEAHSLFDKLFERRIMLRLIGVRFSGLVHGSEQMNLFQDTSEQQSLYHKLDVIRRRYGTNAIVRASALKLRDR